MAKSKINFRQTKYVLPAILYLPLIAVGWLVIDLFQTDVAETADPRFTTTNYLNDKLPDAKVRELGDKRSNMDREFGGISDLTAVEGVQPDSLRESILPRKACPHRRLLNTAQQNVIAAE